MTSLILHLFVVVLSWIAKWGDCQDICGICQRHMLCKLANPLTKRTLLVIWQIQDRFSTSRNKSSNLVLKPSKSIHETSEEVLFIKARQIAQQNNIYRDLMMQLDSCSTEAVSIENYKIRISRSNFTHIHVYLYRVSFLTTLDIYKNYFKGRLTGRNQIKLDAKVLCKHIVTGDICPGSSFFFKEIAAFIHRKVL